MKNKSWITINKLILPILLMFFVISILTTEKVVASSKHGGALIIGVPGSQKKLKFCDLSKNFFRSIDFNKSF